MAEEKHPVRNGVIAGLIVLAVSSFFPGWSWIVHAIVIVGGVFTWRAPVWLILLIILFVVGTIWLALRVLSGTEPESEQEFYSYKQDSLFGAVWRWQYYYDEPSSPVAYCPTCDMRLVHHEDQGAFYAAGHTQTILICERCQRPIAEIDGDYERVERRVIWEIQRRIRTDQYPKRIDR